MLLFFSPRSVPEMCVGSFGQNWSVVLVAICPPQFFYETSRPVTSTFFAGVPESSVSYWKFFKGVSLFGQSWIDWLHHKELE